MILNAYVLRPIDLLHPHELYALSLDVVEAFTTISSRSWLGAANAPRSCPKSSRAIERLDQESNEHDGFVSGGFEDAPHGFSDTTIVVDGCDNEIRLRHQDTPF